MSPWTVAVWILLNTSCFLLHRRYISRCFPQRVKSGLPKSSGAERNPCYATYCSIRAGMFKISKHHMKQCRHQREKTGKYFLLFLQFLLNWTEDCFCVPTQWGRIQTRRAPAGWRMKWSGSCDTEGELHNCFGMKHLLNRFYIDPGSLLYCYVNCL